MWFLAAMIACGGSDLPTATIQVGDQPLRVEIAATGPARMQGLMHRDHLPDDQGMLFVYPDVAPRSFWMKDTRIPLSIAFADQDGKIVRIAHMEPFDTGHTKSLYPAKYALEVNRGWFEAHGVRKGDTLTGIPNDLEVH